MDPRTHTARHIHINPACAHHYLALFLLATGASPAAGDNNSHCREDLPVGMGVFKLNLTCLETSLQGNLSFEEEEILLLLDYIVTAKIYCTPPNGTETMYNVLNRAILSLSDRVFSTSTAHNLPPDTDCRLSGCYDDASFTYAIPQSSCTIPNLPGSIDPSLSPSHSPSPSPSPSPSSLFLSQSYSFSLSSSTPHNPSPEPPLFSSLPTKTTISLRTQSPSPSQLLSSSSPVSHTAVAINTQSPSPSQQSAQSSAPVSHTVAAIAATLLVTLTIAALSCLIVALRLHNSQKRKILKIGQDNWKTEALESDYNPLDLSKKYLPSLISQESIIAPLCESRGCSLDDTSTVDSAAVPEISHRSSDNITTGFLELTNNSSSRERVSEQGAGFVKLTGQIAPAKTMKSTVNTYDNNSGSADILSLSGNTSGYDTGCNSDSTVLDNSTDILPQSSSDTILSRCDDDACPLEFVLGEALSETEKEERNSATSEHDDAMKGTCRQDHNPQRTLPRQHNDVSVTSSLSDIQKLTTKEEENCISASDNCNSLTCVVCSEKLVSKAATTAPDDAHGSVETLCKRTEVISLPSQVGRQRNATTSGSTCTSGSLMDYAGYIHIESPL